MNLKQKARWVLLSFSVVPLTLFAWLHLANFFAESRTNAQAHLTDVAEIAAVMLDGTMITALRDTRAMAATIWRHADDEQKLAEDLERFAIHYPYFRELLWVRPSGVVGQSTTRAHVGRRIEEVRAKLAEPFARTLVQPGGLQISDFDEITPDERARLVGGSDADELALQFLLRTDDDGGTVRGVLVAEVRSGALNTLLREAARHIPGGQPALLLNERGELLLSTGEGRLLKRHALAAPGESIIGDLVVGRAALQGLPGSSKAVWHVVVSAPLALVTEQARLTLWFTSALMLGVITLGLLASLYLARRIDRRIGVLAEGTQRMSRGEFSHRLPVHPADELGALAESFNGMACEIETLLSIKERATREQQTLTASLEKRRTELETAVVRMERLNLEVTLRNEMGELLQSCIGIHEAGVVVARFAPQLFAGASGAAYLATSGAENLIAVSRWGETAPAESLAVTDCWAIRRGKTHLVTDADTALLCPHVNGPLVGVSVCVPLSAHGEALGLLHMTCPDICEPGSTSMLEKQELAEALAAQVGMALANLRLRETLHQQSIRDALTGLYNRRYLEGALPRELARAQRGGRPLAVFMLDIDHFKNFNDTYGHDAGDAVLKALGKALRDNCRQGDIACRFGGEEFTLILPDADLPAAREWAERLMQRVRTMEVKAGGQTLPKIAISMGLALLPQHGEDAETLLQAADLALYDAKHAGRDRLVVSGEQHDDPQSIA